MSKTVRSRLLDGRHRVLALGITPRASESGVPAITISLQIMQSENMPMRDLVDITYKIPMNWVEYPNEGVAEVPTIAGAYALSQVNKYATALCAGYQTDKPDANLASFLQAHCGGRRHIVDVQATTFASRTVPYQQLIWCPVPHHVPQTVQWGEPCEVA